MKSTSLFRRTRLSAAVSHALAGALLAALAGPAAAATFNWTSGSFVPGTTAPSPLSAADVLNISGAGSKSFSGVAWVSNGTVQMLAGSSNVSFGSGASVTSNGLWDIQGDSSLTYPGGGASFTNTGNLRKSGGSGTSSLSGSNFVFVNSGVLDAQTGTLRLASPLTTFNAGSSFIGAGVVEVASNASWNGAFTSANLNIVGGTQTGNAAVLNGVVDWSVGTLAGTWTVAGGQTLNLSSAGSKNVSGGGSLLTNDGTVRLLASSGNLSLGSGGAVLNNGTWDFQGDNGITYPGGGASFTNNGTMRKSGGAGVSSISGSNLVFSNTGTIEAQSGTLRLDAGSMSFGPGSAFTGAGAVEVTANASFTGGFTSSNLRLAAGTQTGSAAVLNGSAAWTAGTLAGTWEVSAGSALNLSTSASKTITGATTTLTNNGIVTVAAGSPNLTLTSNADVINNGTWNVQGDSGLTYSGGGVTTFINNGTLRKSGGAGTSLFNNASNGFANTATGTVDVQTGTLALPGTFTNAGRLTGSGTLQSTGVLTNNGTLAPGSFGTGTLALAGASLTQGAGAVYAVDLTNLAAFDLLTVSGNTVLNGTLALNCLGACSFAIGDTITVLDGAGTLSGTFSSVTLAGFATGAFNVIYDLPTASVRLQVTQAVTAVPEPGTWALLAAGLGVVGFMARRRATQGAAQA